MAVRLFVCLIVALCWGVSAHAQIGGTGIPGQAPEVTRFNPVALVTNFGADPTGVGDSAPAFRLAIQSNQLILVPPGTYRFASAVTAPCCALDDAAVLVSNKTNFAIFGYGATIVVDSSIALSTAFHFDQDTNFQVFGLTIQGSRSGLSAGDENVGITLTSDVNFRVSDIHFTTGFGGNGTGFAGDWLVNGTLDNIVMDGSGQCVDFAFLLHFTIDKMYAKGVDTNGNSGAGQVGQKCISVINDLPNAATNHTGITFTATDDVSIRGVEEYNYVTGAFIASGTHYALSHNYWHDNPGAVTSPGTGILIGYLSSGAASSVGFPPSDITINGDMTYNNGTAVAGFGVLISALSISNSDVIQNIVVANTLFDNNTANGLHADTTSHISNVSVVGDEFSGANQTLGISNNILALSGIYINTLAKVPGNLSVTGQLQMSTNNSSFAWLDSNGALQPVMGLSPSNIFFQRPGSSAAYIDLQTYAGNSVFQILSTGAARITPGLFSALPACVSGNEGAIGAITDGNTSTLGHVVSGGSSTHAMVYCDGTNGWIVASAKQP